MEYVVNYLTGAFPYFPEFINFGMALEGAMVVKRGVNKDGRLHWFHAFFLSVVTSFGGGIFTKAWMGEPSGFLANDLCMACSVLAFVLVNLIPLGFRILDFLPLNILTISASNLFRSTAIPVYVTFAFQIFKEKPSAYYSIPIVGPILYATLLGNMGAFFLKGFEKHIENGMPWPIQNGIFCASFYHFYVHDQDGPIGQMLRTYLPVAAMLGLSDATFAAAFVSLFMQITGILRMDQFLGPSFTPFASEILSPFMDLSTWTVGKGDTVYAAKKKDQESKKTVAEPAKMKEQSKKSVAEPTNKKEPSSNTIAVPANNKEVSNNTVAAVNTPAVTPAVTTNKEAAEVEATTTTTAAKKKKPKKKKSKSTDASAATNTVEAKKNQ
ncbi:hypothetical protein ACA910_015956 [Epithemia clementina (nom. ined.)]